METLMSTIKMHNIIALASIFFAPISVQATNTPSRSCKLKTALALTALGTVGKVVVTFPEATAVFAMSASAGLLTTTAAYQAGRYSGADDSTIRGLIGVTNTLGFGVGAALHDYIPNTTAAGAGYVLTCGALATLSRDKLADVVGVGSWR